MSYDVSFKCKTINNKEYDVGESFGITYNLGDLFEALFDGKRLGDLNNKKVKEVLPILVDGIAKLERNMNKYKMYNALNGWGTIDNALKFLRQAVDEINRLDDEELIFEVS